MLIADITTEDELLSLIASTDVVLKITMPDCPACNNFQSVFNEVISEFPDTNFAEFLLTKEAAANSNFRKTYMIPEGNERVAAPALFIFQAGEMKARKFGPLSKDAFVTFIGLKDVTVDSLYLEKGRLISEIQSRQSRLQEIDNLLTKAGAI